MRIFIPPILPGKPTLDILGGNTQIFQGDAMSVQKFIVSKLANADFIVVPHDAAFWSKEYELKLCELSDTKPIVYFNRSDFPLNVQIPNSYSFQNHLSLHDQSNQIIIPYNVKKIKNSKKREYSPLPVVSFVGYVPNFISRGTLLHLKSDFPVGLWNNPSVVRKLGLKRITTCKLPTIVETRSHYGGAKSLVLRPKTFRSEFEASIKNSDLIFCPRGTGNSSQRFYEALSAGRIPVVPDTKIVFPKYPGINLDDFLIFTSPFSLRIKSDVMKFWSKLNSSSYFDLQEYLIFHVWRRLSYNSYISYLFQELATGNHLEAFISY
jgi:hypothetical protein